MNESQPVEKRGAIVRISHEVLSTLLNVTSGRITEVRYRPDHDSWEVTIINPDEEFTLGEGLFRSWKVLEGSSLPIIGSESMVGILDRATGEVHRLKAEQL